DGQGPALIVSLVFPKGRLGHALTVRDQAAKERTGVEIPHLQRRVRARRYDSCAAGGDDKVVHRYTLRVQRANERPTGPTQARPKRAQPRSALSRRLTEELLEKLAFWIREARQQLRPKLGPVARENMGRKLQPVTHELEAIVHHRIAKVGQQ